MHLMTHPAAIVVITSMPYAKHTQVSQMSVKYVSPLTCPRALVQVQAWPDNLETRAVVINRTPCRCW